MRWKNSFASVENVYAFCVIFSFMNREPSWLIVPVLFFFFLCDKLDKNILILRLGINLPNPKKSIIRITWVLSTEWRFSRTNYDFSWLLVKRFYLSNVQRSNVLVVTKFILLSLDFLNWLILYLPNHTVLLVVVYCKVGYFIIWKI